MRSRRHHVEAVNPPKHPDCGESSIDIHVLTTSGGLSDGMTASDAIFKSLATPAMICKITRQPSPGLEDSRTIRAPDPGPQLWYEISSM